MEIGLLARLVFGLAAAALVGWLAGTTLGLTAGSTTSGIVLRTLLVVGILALLARALLRRAHASPRLPRTLAGGALLSYAVFPPTWNGRALLAQLAVEPGIATALADGALWVAVVVLASRSVTPKPAARESVPYG